MCPFQLLEAHNKEVENFRYIPNFCRYCRGGKKTLKARQLIRRRVRFVENFLVHREYVLVLLWTCTCCSRSFRHLPPFLRKHKRFITPTIKDMAANILRRRRQPYRKTARKGPPHPKPILYAKGDGSRLSHVSIWRWIQWMGEEMAQLTNLHPKMAKANEEQAPFEYSPLQAISLKCREKLYLAQEYWLGAFLT